MGGFPASGSRRRLHGSIGKWQTRPKRLCEIAKVSKGHAHRLRDTFAVELLLRVCQSCVARASEHSSYRTALRAMDEVKAGTARVRFEAGMERRSSCYRTNTGYTTGTRKSRND